MTRTRTKVAIIGVGQIGKYHLQALLKMQRPVDIFLVDPSHAALKQANKSTIHDIVSCRQTSSLPTELDIVIMATTAAVRKMILEDLLSRTKIKYLILEKVVFQHPDHFIKINELLNKGQVKTWVNCPLRMVPFFRRLKRKWEENRSSTPHLSESLDYHVSGSLWNLGSNAIHHLDLFAYLTGESNLLLDSSLLDLETISSKRQGFIEFTGTLRGKTEKGNTITLTSYKEKTIPQIIRISSIYGRLIFMQHESKAWISDESVGWGWAETDLIIPYQSMLTNLVVEQLIDTGTCHLTTFEQSWKLHVPLLNVLLGHLLKHTTRRVDRCPIT